MREALGLRLRHAWNAFMSRDPTRTSVDLGYGSSYRPDRVRLGGGNERSIINSVYNRIAVDVAAVAIRHVRTDQNGMYEETIDSPLNNCLTLSANIDQTSRAFIIDTVMSLFDEGCIALLPIETSANPRIHGSYDIYQLRTARITEWFPKDIRAEAYNEKLGQKAEVIVEKKDVAIIENPMFSVMNEPNSTLRRLVRKLNILDSIDEQSGAGKLDLIIQLPYTTKSPLRKQQAEDRRKDVEDQLAGSKYGIAYIDATERITQLNRPAENNLMTQIEYLTSMLFSQLGISKAVFDGTADEKAMLNYYNRTIEPILSAIVDEIKRKFLTKTARTQGQSIMFFKDPFKLVSVNEVANMADTFTRNEILSSNDFRAIIGRPPSKDPRADKLENKNINRPTENEKNSETKGDI